MHSCIQLIYSEQLHSANIKNKHMPDGVKQYVIYFWKVKVTVTTVVLSDKDFLIDILCLLYESNAMFSCIIMFGLL